MSDIKKAYRPDFGFKETLEFEDRKPGWLALLEAIKKYPQEKRLSKHIKESLKVHNKKRKIEEKKTEELKKKL